MLLNTWYLISCQSRGVGVSVFTPSGVKWMPRFILTSFSFFPSNFIFKYTVLYLCICYIRAVVPPGQHFSHFLKQNVKRAVFCLVAECLTAPCFTAGIWHEKLRSENGWDLQFCFQNIHVFTFLLIFNSASSPVPVCDCDTLCLQVSRR